MSTDFIVHSVGITEGTENHLNLVISWKDDGDTVFGFEDVHFVAEGSDLVVKYKPVAHTRKDDVSDEELKREADRILNTVLENAFPEMRNISVE